MNHSKEFGFDAEDTGEPKNGLEELRKLFKIQGVGKWEGGAGEETGRLMQGLGIDG